MQFNGITQKCEVMCRSVCVIRAHLLKTLVLKALSNLKRGFELTTMLGQEKM